MTERVEFLDIVTAGRSIFGLLTRAGGKVAGQEGNNQKSGKGHHVFSGVDDVLPGRMEEIMDEGSNGNQGHRNGDNDSPNGGNS